MTSPNMIIRLAERRDLAAIHNLVRELAIYEKAEPEFVATLEEYERDFADSVFESLVAEAEGKVVGMMLYYLTYSTWKGRMLYLEDFVVLPSYRRYGIGQRLFEELQEVARQKRCKLMKWQVLDWNEPAIRFYEKNDAVIEKEWWNGKLFLD